MKTQLLQVGKVAYLYPLSEIDQGAERILFPFYEFQSERTLLRMAVEMSLKSSSPVEHKKINICYLILIGRSHP